MADEEIWASYAMIFDEIGIMHLQNGTQPFTRLVEAFVLRQMKQHSSFNDFRLRWRKDEKATLPSGYYSIIWEAFKEF